MRERSTCEPVSEDEAGDAEAAALGDTLARPVLLKAALTSFMMRPLPGGGAAAGANAGGGLVMYTKKPVR